MPRVKDKYVEFYLDRKLLPLLEKLLADDKVKLGLLEHNLKETASGVAKYAVLKMLKDKNMFLADRKQTRSTA